MRKFWVGMIILGILLLACGTSTPAAPTTDINGIVAQTMAAYTVQALLTQAANPTLTQPAATAIVAATPTSTTVPATSTSAPEEQAPNPLPVGYTGVILNNGECFNFDTGGVSVPDQRCDLWLVSSGLFRQVNGAKLSGYVTLEPPTRTHCINGRYEPGDLAVQTDMFMCFVTDEGRVGYIVVRQYRGSVPFTGIVFDYWVFR